VSLRRAVLLLALCASCPGPGLADEVLLAPSKDNTLYESLTGALSNGAGPYFFVGRTNQSGPVAIRRGLLAFDLSGVPAGSAVVSATLELYCSMLPPGGPTPARLVRLHRVLANWGEGSSNSAGAGGAGATAQPGDATWLDRFNPDSMWAVPGGDFLAAPSSTQSVGDIGSYGWTGLLLVNDVQSWLDSPTTNFGWLVSSEEAVPGTARRFDSRQNSVVARRPLLRVIYDAPVAVRASTWGRMKALYRDPR
jgi:hypothetical protein